MGSFMYSLSSALARQFFTSAQIENKFAMGPNVPAVSGNTVDINHHNLKWRSQFKYSARASRGRTLADIYLFHLHLVRRTAHEFVCVHGVFVVFLEFGFGFYRARVALFLLKVWAIYRSLLFQLVLSHRVPEWIA